MEGDQGNTFWRNWRRGKIEVTPTTNPLTYGYRATLESTDRDVVLKLAATAKF